MKCKEIKENHLSMVEITEENDYLSGQDEIINKQPGDFLNEFLKRDSIYTDNQGTLISSYILKQMLSRLKKISLTSIILKRRHSH